MKMNKIAVALAKEMKILIKKNKHVESKFRKLKSHVDLRTHYEVQTSEVNHTMSLDSLLRMMRGGYRNNKKKLEKHTAINPSSYNVNYVNSALSLYKMLLESEVPNNDKDENYVVIVGRRFFKGKYLGKTIDLVKLASDDNPEKKIYYIPSQSELTNNPSITDNIPRNVKVLSYNTNPLSYILYGDEIYTVNSLWGFDALVLGKKINVYGRPFYYCCDAVTHCNETPLRSLSLHEITYNYLVKDIEYNSPLCIEAISLTESIIWGYLSNKLEFQGFFSKKSVEKTKTREFNYTSSIKHDIKTTLRDIAKKECTTSGDLIVFLMEEKVPGKENVNKIFDLKSSKAPIYYFSVENYFRRLVEYDKLQEFEDIFVTEFSESFETFNNKEKIKIVDLLSDSVKKTRGRKPKAILTINPLYLDISFTGNKLWFSLLNYYLLRFEYSNVFQMIDSVNDESEQMWFRVGMLLHNTEGNNAFRVDKDWYARQACLDYVANKFKKSYFEQYLNKNPSAEELNLLDSVCSYLVKNFEEFTKTFVFYVPPKRKLYPYESKYIKTCLNFLSKCHKNDMLIKLVKNWGGDVLVQELSIEAIYLSALIKNDNIDDAEAYIDSNNLHNVKYICRKSGSLYIMYAMIVYYKHQGDFSKAIDMLNSFRKYCLLNSIKIKKRDFNKISEMVKNLSFFLETKDFLAMSKDSISYKGVIFQTHCVDHWHAIAMSAPVLHRLRNMGYLVVSLSREANVAPETGSYIQSKYTGRLGYACSDGQILLDWDIDWNNKKVVHNGINYYQGIYEQLSIRYRAFDIDILKPGIQRFFQLTLSQCDFALRLCKEISDDESLKELPLVFLGATSHRAPASVFRDFAMQCGYNIFYTSFNIGYEKYYKGQSTRLSSMLTVLDMTMHRECRAGFLAIKSRFKNWLSNPDNVVLAKERSKLLLNMNRGNTAIDGTTKYESSSIVEQAKKEGKKVICCFGKMTCDLAVPVDGGSAHSDMKDWINHTVDIASESEDILLLIKPHPVELVAESALDLQQYFRDLLPEKLPKNVIFLGHNEFRVPELAPYLDLAILYNGTSAMELTILGVPVMMTSYYGKHDYPINLIYPENRSGYRDYILEGKYAIPNENLRTEAAGLLYYMGTNDVSLENRITNRSSTNDNIGAPTYNKVEMNKYLEHGCEQINLAALRAVESAEAFRKHLVGKINA